MPDHSYFANLIWQIADLLRGPYRPPQYERVMLPMTVLRRFDCVLAIDRLERFYPGGSSLYRRVLIQAAVNGDRELAWIYTIEALGVKRRRIVSGRWLE